jgi:hypothetical protein
MQDTPIILIGVRTCFKWTDRCKQSHANPSTKTTSGAHLQHATSRKKCSSKHETMFFTSHHHFGGGTQQRSRSRIDFFVVPVAGVANESEILMPEAEAVPKFSIILGKKTLLRLRDAPT